MGNLKNIYIFGIIYNTVLILAYRTKVYEVTAFNAKERAELYKLEVTNRTVIFLSELTNDASLSTDILVDDCCTRNFEKTLQLNNIEYSSVDIGSMFADIKNNGLPGEKFISNVKKFPTYDEWIKQINIMVKKSNTLITKTVISHTHEKEDIFVLELVSNPKNPGVFIISGELGGDWMASSVMLKFIEKILAHEAGLDELTSYYNFYFAPFANPDGYIYNWEKDLFWNKNRNAFFPQTQCKDGDFAVGVNIDRNWFFGENNNDNVCNAVYIGPSSLSESESRAYAEYINNIANKLMAFINIRRSGKRLLTIPYAYTMEYSINHDVMMAIMKAVQSKLRKEHNVLYIFERTANYIYNFSGNSCDWVKKMLNVPVVYTIHLQNTQELFLSPKVVEPMILELTTIVKESLNMAKKIYGPLFNKENMLLGSFINLLAVMVNIVLIMTELN